MIPPLLFALYSTYITDLLTRLRLYCRPQLIGQQSRGFAGVCDLHSKMDPHRCKNYGNTFSDPSHIGNERYHPLHEYLAKGNCTHRPTE